MMMMMMMIIMTTTTKTCEKFICIIPQNGQKDQNSIYSLITIVVQLLCSYSLDCSVSVICHFPCRVIQTSPSAQRYSTQCCHLLLLLRMMLTRPLYKSGWPPPRHQLWKHYTWYPASWSIELTLTCLLKRNHVMLFVGILQQCTKYQPTIL